MDEKKNALEDLDNVEIEPLSDEEMDDAAGGISIFGCCSCLGCSRSHPDEDSVAQ